MWPSISNTSPTLVPPSLPMQRNEKPALPRKHQEAHSKTSTVNPEFWNTSPTLNNRRQKHFKDSPTSAISIVSWRVGMGSIFQVVSWHGVGELLWHGCPSTGVFHSPFLSFSLD